MRRFIIGLVTHGAALGLGFGLGVYFLPILTAPPSPDAATLEAMAEDAVFTAAFQEDLRGNDLLHWGTGTVSLTPSQIVHTGELAPGPDFRVYLVPSFVAHEDEFAPLKAQSQIIGSVRTFQGFSLDIPEGVDIEAYTTVLVWCEAFSEFIAAAQYR
ncbi:MAG: DM13 domain-containing protein [Pseudomonadota bacterium]